MCIIVSKKKGVEIPSMKVLAQCFKNNPDGSGYAFYRDGQVHIKKGFMSFEKMKKDLVIDKIKTSENAIYHFRFATHGLMDGGNCHPFPLSSSKRMLRKKYLDTDIAVAHNGQFHDMPDDDVLSDTMKYIKLYLSFDNIVNNIRGKEVEKMLKERCGNSSRLVFLDSIGIQMVGTWQKVGGLYYSNGGYRARIQYVSSGFASYKTNYQSPSRSYHSSDWHKTDWGKISTKQVAEKKESCEFCGTDKTLKKWDGLNVCNNCTVYFDKI